MYQISYRLTPRHHLGRRCWIGRDGTKAIARLRPGRHVRAPGGTHTPAFPGARVGYRFYEPNLQRWLNRDPIGETGSINLYRGFRNNPPSYYDPFGWLDYPPDFVGPPVPSPALPDPSWKPPGWKPRWPEGFDLRGPYYQDLKTGQKWYPHPEDEGHWPHYDNDKGQRFPEKCTKPWPTQKRPPYGDQSPTNPWPEPSPPWWKRIGDFLYPIGRLPVILIPHPSLWDPDWGRDQGPV